MLVLHQWMRVLIYWLTMGRHLWELTVRLLPSLTSIRGVRRVCRCVHMYVYPRLFSCACLYCAVLHVCLSAAYLLRMSIVLCYNCIGHDNLVITLLENCPQLFLCIRILSLVSFSSVFNKRLSTPLYLKTQNTANCIRIRILWHHFRFSFFWYRGKSVIYLFLDFNGLLLVTVATDCQVVTAF